MRILHIGKYFPPDPGGMETYLRDLVDAQQEQGLDVAVLVHGTPREDDPPWLRRVPVTTTLLYAPVAPAFRRRLAGLLREFKPDVLHLHMPNNSVFWTLTLPAARMRPWVVHWHADVVSTRTFSLLGLAYLLYQPFERAVLDQATRIIATSPDYLAASTPLVEWYEKSTVVPLGLRLATARTETAGPAQHDWPAGKLRLLSIGRLTYYKDFATLVRAVSVLPDVHLVIVGSGELQASLSALIDQLTPAGQAPNITLAGGVDEDEKQALLASCDAFCLASCERTEAFGIVVMEAMQHAKPCLVSELDGSGLPWLVRSSHAGRTIAVGDVHAWQEAIQSLQAHPEQARAWGKAGQKALHERFLIGIGSKQISRLYDALFAPAESLPDSPPAIVMPARNEAASIVGVIRKLHEQGYHDIIVVNDQSTDATARLAHNAGATVLSPVLPLGAWGATQAGIRHAWQQGYRQVVSMDADGQHAADEIATLLLAARDHDVVIGSHTARGSTARRIAWTYFRLITGLRMQDLTSGFRCYNQAAMHLLASEEATLLDYQDLGVLLLLRQAGLQTGEVPVRMLPRQDGHSRIFSSWYKVAYYMLESTLLCLSRWRPRHYFRRRHD